MYETKKVDKGMNHLKLNLIHVRTPTSIVNREPILRRRTCGTCGAPEIVWTRKDIINNYKDHLAGISLITSPLSFFILKNLKLSCLNLFSK